MKKKNNAAIFQLAVLLIGIYPLTTYSAPELKGAPDELGNYLLEQRKLVLINGKGEEKVDADAAKVALIVKTKDDKLREALQKNRNIRENIKKKLIGAEINPENIQFSRYSSTPNFSWFGDKPSSYEVTNEVKITINDEEKLLAIAKLVDDIQEVFFINTELEHSNKNQAEIKALEKSLDDIGIKRTMYENKLGITLVPIRVIEQSVSAQDVEISPLPSKKYQIESEPESSFSSSRYAAKRNGTSSGFGEIVYSAFTQVEYIITSEKVK